jgi:hypothetical protein
LQESAVHYSGDRVGGKHEPLRRTMPSWHVAPPR